MDQVDRIVLVGHCGADQYSLGRMVASVFGDEVSVSSVNTDDALDHPEASKWLLLVNRVLDGRFEAGSGVELIGRLAKRADPPALMLISDYGDAQAQAVHMGAEPGFGKSQLREPKSEMLLKHAASMS